MLGLFVFQKSVSTPQGLHPGATSPAVRLISGATWQFHPHESWCDSVELSAGTLLEPFGKITVLKDEDEEEGGCSREIKPEFRSRA